MIFNCVLVRFSGEFGVKSLQTQQLLENLIKQNIRNALISTGNKDLEKRLQIVERKGRYYLVPLQPIETDIPNLVNVVGRTFGLSTISPCFRTSFNDKTSIHTIPAKLMLAHEIYPQSKKISIKIVDRQLSVDVKLWKDEILALCEKFSRDGNATVTKGQKVNKYLKGKKLTEGNRRVSKNRFKAVDNWDMGPWMCRRETQLEIEVYKKFAYISGERIKAPGGFPLGLEDTFVATVSGGFDSPVAAWLALRRGAPLIFVTMNSGLDEMTDKSDIEKKGPMLLKAYNEVKVLAEYMRGLPSNPILIVVPYGKILERFAAFGGKAGVSCLLCKRTIYRVAESIAYIYGAKGVVTGEILGEQASQTAQNLMVMQSVVTLPIHRPLFGYDKSEVIERSRQIGIYPVATISQGACKGVPEHPTVRGNQDVVEEIEKKLNAENVVKECIKNMKVIEITF